MEEIKNEIENKESIKLIKNTKGYQWEIKVKDEQITEDTLNRLCAIDSKLKKEYGDSDEKTN